MNINNINTTQSPLQPLLQPAPPSGKPHTDFQAALETAQLNLAPSGGATPTKPDYRAGRKPESQMTPLEYLTDYLKKSPEQHMRDAILRKMGLTEEDLNTMPPDIRAEIEHEIADKIKELLQEKSNNPQPQGQSSVSLQSLLSVQA
jgi:hypothetical protein